MTLMSKKAAIVAAASTVVQVDGAKAVALQIQAEAADRQAAIEKLISHEVEPLQEYQEFPIGLLGWHVPMAKQLAGQVTVKTMKGAFVGGLGYFEVPEDKEKIRALFTNEGLADAFWDLYTTEKVETVKTSSFLYMLKEPANSFYYWALQPIYTWDNRITGAEVLIRAKNGSQTAPFQDVLEFLANGKEKYAEWKVGEITTFMEQECQSITFSSGGQNKLAYVTVNLRLEDLRDGAPVRKGVFSAVDNKRDDDGIKLTDIVVIEVTEDQDPEEIFGANGSDPKQKENEALGAWVQKGFKLSYDDGFGDIARLLVDDSEKHFHTLRHFETVKTHFDVFKIDGPWVRMFFAPYWTSKAKSKLQALNPGCSVVEVEQKFAAVKQEFADALFKLLEKDDIKVVIEFSVDLSNKEHAAVADEISAMARENPKNKFPVGLMDLFKHPHLTFQGGPTENKAFTPEALSKPLEALAYYTFSPIRNRAPLPKKEAQARAAHTETKRSRSPNLQRASSTRAHSV